MRSQPWGSTGWAASITRAPSSRMFFSIHRSLGASPRPCKPGIATTTRAGVPCIRATTLGGRHSPASWPPPPPSAWALPLPARLALAPASLSMVAVTVRRSPRRRACTAPGAPGGRSGPPGTKACWHCSSSTRPAGLSCGPRSVAKAAMRTSAARGSRSPWRRCRRPPA